MTLKKSTFVSVFHLCISEKKDLVELVIRQNASSSTVSGSGGGQQESSSSSSRPTNPPAPAQSGSSSRRAPEERQKSFPKAYVESTHRHEWLEKMNENANKNTSDQVQLSCEEDDDDFIVVTPVTPMTSKFRKTMGKCGNEWSIMHS